MKFLTRKLGSKKKMKKYIRKYLFQEFKLLLLVCIMLDYVV